MNTANQGRNPTAAAIGTHIESLLVSPGDHKRLEVTGNLIAQKESALSWELRDGVAVMVDEGRPSYFDDKFEVMQRGHENAGEWSFCYAKQIQLFEKSLKAGQVILDIGCGPWLPYQTPADSIVVGLEPSFHSLRANQQLDLRVMASAQNIPMADRSVDAIVCFYSIHHMVGNSIEATRSNVLQSLKEFSRVLKPGGSIFVFEMSPIVLFDIAQRIFWPFLRKKAPNLLDMYFWRQRAFRDFSTDCLPENLKLDVISFPTSPFVVFSPAFSLPWLKVPRFMYPLSPFLYKWTSAC